MHRYALPIAVLATLAIAEARACVNEYGTSIGGSARLRSHGRVPMSITINTDHYRKQVALLSPRLADSPSHIDLSDLGVAFLYLGELDLAIELLVQAESQKPNEYVIASNLGTAYELARRNVEALKWIEEGIRRNPDSHDGSEWIHVNLLRAKIAMEDEPEWIQSNSVTGLHFGNGPSPVFDASLSQLNCPESPNDIRSHLEHQLYERRKFIPGRDPIVAVLMFDLANATALSNTVEDAMPIYLAARDLGFHDAALLAKRIVALKNLQHGNLLSGWTYDSIALFALGSALVLGFGVLRARRLTRGKNTTNRGMHTEASVARLPMVALPLGPVVPIVRQRSHHDEDQIRQSISDSFVVLRVLRGHLMSRNRSIPSFVASLVFMVKQEPETSLQVRPHLRVRCDFKQPWAAMTISNQ